MVDLSVCVRVRVLNFSKTDAPQLCLHIREFAAPQFHNTGLLGIIQYMFKCPFQMSALNGLLSKTIYKTLCVCDGYCDSFELRPEINAI